MLGQDVFMKKFCPDCNTAFDSNIGYCDACGHAFDIVRDTKAGGTASLSDKQSDQLLYILSFVAALIGAMIPYLLFGR